MEMKSAEIGRNVCTLLLSQVDLMRGKYRLDLARSPSQRDFTGSDAVR